MTQSTDYRAAISRRGRFQRALLAVSLLAGLATLGCGDRQEIRHYKVLKPELVYAINHVDPDDTGDAEGLAGGPTDRLLGAIVPRGSRTWYFKLTGPPQLVADQEGAFRALIESLQFEESDSPPRWDLPTGWRQEEATGQRYATLSLPAEGRKLEVSVVGLPTGPIEESILANVNRWRRQMQLPPVAEQQLGDITSELDYSDGSAVLVNLVGRFEGGGMNSASLQQRPGPAQEPPARPVPPSLSFTAPAGWDEQERAMFSLLTLAMQQEGRSARITVSRLRGDGGGLLPNINRWNRQVGAPPISQQELARQSESLTVGGIAGTLVNTLEAREQAEGEAVVGWIGMHDGQSWFVKMQGDTALVRDQLPAFREFLETLEFQAP